MTAFTLPTLPAELRWMNDPLDWKVGPDGSLTIQTGPETDWFVDPGGKIARHNAPAALFVPPDDRFILSARVLVAFGALYDAGVLAIRVSETTWAKLCFEYSPNLQPMIVSVVTRGTSDDSNAVTIAGTQVYLRMALTPQTVAFHYSLDGRYWHLVRYFSLGQLAHPAVGFLSQSPTGQQCSAIFSEIRYQAGELNDLRSGE